MTHSLKEIIAKRALLPELLPLRIAVMADSNSSQVISLAERREALRPRLSEQRQREAIPNPFLGAAIWAAIGVSVTLLVLESWAAFN